MIDTDQTQINEGRNSFTGKTLNDAQFDESWALAGILHRAIRKSGSFHEKLTDYSHAFARAEKFDQMKAETIIRDQFKARYGQTLNQLREDMKARETNLPEAAAPDALNHARMIEPLIRDGETMPFYRAYDYVGGALAEKLTITETGAKELMKSAFLSAENRDLYETGKALEKQFHEPARDAARQERTAERQETDATPKPKRTRKIA